MSHAVQLTFYGKYSTSFAFDPPTQSTIRILITSYINGFTKVISHLNKKLSNLTITCAVKWIYPTYTPYTCLEDSTHLKSSQMA